ncbi:MAG TPA: hypothetical protein VH280_11405, partial [Verrucomicrobiae bacterium]|nr:hypothetical protein [Verrucomicrobiae bacterium]
GDIVFINAGTYFPTNQYPAESGVYVPVNLITKSGITYEAVPGTRPVFNFSRVNPPGLRTAAFWVNANHVTFQGFDVVAVQENITNANNQSVGFANYGCNFCAWNQVNVHDGDCVGIYFEKLDASNLVYRCDCYNLAGINNYSDGNADGFGCHVSAGGKGNVFRECRAWNDSDDGYDCINCSESVTFDHCWSYLNGNNGGNGNGFKVGGWASTPQNQIADPVPAHCIIGCLAAGNHGNGGFYANHQCAGPGSPTSWTNNTAYDNVAGFNMLQRAPPDYGTNAAQTDSDDISGTNELMYFNIAFGNTHEDVENLSESGNMVESNSWTESGLAVSATDFAGTDMHQITNSRAPDGSLPVIALLHPAPGDKLMGLGCFVVPPAPANLAASAVNGRVSLMWTASSGAASYNIYRSSTNGGPYTVIARGVTATNYVDTNFSSEEPTYYYVVTALNPGDESSDSPQVAAAPFTGPIINSVFVSSGTFVIQGTGGTTGSQVCLLAATNLAFPNWVPIETNQFDNNGKLTMTNTLNAAAPQSFYRLQLQ